MSLLKKTLKNVSKNKHSKAQQNANDGENIWIIRSDILLLSHIKSDFSR